MKRTDLIQLFNAGFDFCHRDDTDWHYTPCKTAHGATHKLVCTRWNIEEKTNDIRKRIRNHKTRPIGFALAVCAIPLRKRPKRRSALRFVAPVLPWPALPADTPLQGKRAVLLAIVRQAYGGKNGGLARRVRRYSTVQCLRAYKDFAAANRKIQRKRHI